MKLESKHLQSKIWQLKCWHLVVTMFHTSVICIFCVHIFSFWADESSRWIDYRAAFEFKITSQKSMYEVSSQNEIMFPYNFLGGCPASVSQLKHCGVWRKKEEILSTQRTHTRVSQWQALCVILVLSWISLFQVTLMTFKFICWMTWIWRAALFKC